MHITVTKGVGRGPTRIAAFDQALLHAGVANYNLIPLSSVIPPGGLIERSTFLTSSDEYGHRLYVVLARCDVQEVGKHAWAALGWTQEATSGRGLFVEIEGSSEVETHQAIKSTLDSMTASRSYPYGAIEREIVGIQCTDQPACAVVLAVYQSRGWDR